MNNDENYFDEHYYHNCNGDDENYFDHNYSINVNMVMMKIILLKMKMTIRISRWRILVWLQIVGA